MRTRALWRAGASSWAARAARSPRAACGTGLEAGPGGFLERGVLEGRRQAGHVQEPARSGRRSSLQLLVHGAAGLGPGPVHALQQVFQHGALAGSGGRPAVLLQAGGMDIELPRQAEDVHEPLQGPPLGLVAGVGLGVHQVQHGAEAPGGDAHLVQRFLRPRPSLRRPAGPGAPPAGPPGRGGAGSPAQPDASDDFRSRFEITSVFLVVSSRHLMSSSPAGHHGVSGRQPKRNPRKRKIRVNWEAYGTHSHQGRPRAQPQEPRPHPAAQPAGGDHGAVGFAASPASPSTPSTPRASGATWRACRAYARQFLDQMEKPDVDSIEGLSPAISIEQKTTSKNPRSTVATVTEIYDYLRLLFARTGKPTCLACGKAIASQTIQEMADQILAQPEGTKLQILAPVVRGRKGEYKKLLQDLMKRGYIRARRQRADAGPHRRRAGPGQAEEAHHRGGHRPPEGEPRHPVTGWRTAWRSPATWQRAPPSCELDGNEAAVLLEAGLQQREVRQASGWACRSWSRAPSPSTPPTAPAPPATAWASSASSPRS